MQEGIYGYPCLKHLRELWLGDWIEQMSKTNEEVGERNQHQKAGGEDTIEENSSNEFWKYIWCILLSVTHGKK